MGGRGSSAAGSQGVHTPAAQPAPPPQTRAQQLMAQVAADPTALASLSDADAQTVVQSVAQLPIVKNGTQEDSFMQRWLNHIGFTAGKPRVLDERSFNAAARNSGATVLYHADAPHGGTPSGTFVQQLLTGPTMYAAGGIYGDGTYWATSASASASYGGSTGTQVKGFISKTRGRVAGPTEARKALAAFKNSHPKTWAWLQRNAKTKPGYSPSESLTAMALTAAGYNAYDFDRSTLTLCSKTRKARGVTRNW